MSSITDQVENCSRQLEVLASIRTGEKLMAWGGALTKSSGNCSSFYGRVFQSASRSTARLLGGGATVDAVANQINCIASVLGQALYQSNQKHVDVLCILKAAIDNRENIIGAYEDEIEKKGLIEAAIDNLRDTHKQLLDKEKEGAFKPNNPVT